MAKFTFVPKRPFGNEPWVEFGATREEYEFWAPHVCAIACVRTLLLAHNSVAPSLWKLTQRALELDVFKVTEHGVDGAFHRPLTTLLECFNISSYVFGSAAENQIWDALESHALMLSIDLKKFQNSLDGSHLVLLHDKREPRTYVLHDSASVLKAPGNNVQIDRTLLGRLSNGRGIAVPLLQFPTST